MLHEHALLIKPFFSAMLVSQGVCLLHALPCESGTILGEGKLKLMNKIPARNHMQEYKDHFRVYFKFSVIVLCL